MSITEQILDELLNKTLYSKGVPTNILGSSRFKTISRSTLSQTLYRMSKKNYIEKKDGGYIISPTGKKYISNKMKNLQQFDKPKNTPPEKILLVFFDIPESHRKHREWFRLHLKRFDYEMIQQSVWIGPDPLPPDFMDYLKEIELEHCIETIRLAKPYKKKKPRTSYFAKLRSMI